MKKLTESTPLTPSEERTEKTNLGLWVYLMTDVILFGCLFAVYAVLHQNTNGGPGAAELFDLPVILVSTILLLVSSFTSGLMIVALKRANKLHVFGWLAFTALLGVAFLVLELMEFNHLIDGGNSWARSGFLTAFFTLVATHGIHIAVGILWAATLLWQITRRGLTEGVSRRLGLFAMFWHFLDVIWIFIFTLVYLMGAVQL